MARHQQLDVLVVGGGPAGCSAATALARQGLAVTLLEKSSYETPRVGETLPPAIAPWLYRLGAMEAFQKDAHLPCPGAVSTWATGQPEENDFIFSPYGQGWHLDRRRFDQTLAALAREAGVEVRPGRSWAGMAKDARPRIVLDASGRRAVVARSLGVSRGTLDRQVAVYGFGEAAAGAESRTMIEAAPEGWWYGALLPGRKAVAAYFTDGDLLPGGALARRSRWLVLLAAAPAVAALLADPGRAGELKIVAASASRLDRFAGPGWLAAGDAAMTFDPLSSQGILKAITSGLQAAEAIVDCLAGNQGAISAYSAGLEADFEHYHRQRRRHYARVQRWPQSPYWQRRHEAQESVVALLRNQRRDSLSGRAATSRARTGS